MSLLSSQLLEQLNSGLAAQAPSRASGSNELGQEDFFQLMIAQLQNQDPAKPLDPNEYLGQLAQFSTLSGIQQLGQSFDSMAQSLNSLQALQASSMVGRQVVVDSDAGWLSEDGPMRGTVLVDENVNELSLGVYDAAGRLVDRVSLGSHPMGAVPFAWDGMDANGNPMEPGTYTVRAEGQVGTENRAFATRVAVPVQSVSLSQNGATLNLAGLGERRFSDVHEII